MRNTLQDIGILDFYQNKNRIKWLIFISSVVISFGSIYYTNILVEELKDREKRQIELLARALEYASSASIDAENLSFITSEIIQQNNSIPVIVVDANGNPTDHKNIKFKKNANQEEIDKVLRAELEKMKQEYEPIRGEEYLVFYRNSELLTSLKFYPYVQLSVILAVRRQEIGDRR